jgi:hypothetical protein
MGEALRIVYRVISGFLIHKAGLTRSTGQCGAVTLIQRFGSALNLNVHFHMLIPDGVYLTETDPPYLRRVSPPTTAELQALAQRISERIGRHLERKGLLVRDLDSSHLALEPGDTADALTDLQGHSITYRIALGPHKGRKAFMLQSLPPRGEPPGSRVAQAAGFSLHAGVATEADQRDKLERLCRYIARPAVAIERLSLTAQGHVRYALKTPYRDGTTHVIFEPLDFLSRLAALVPSPGVNLTRYHGVFAANHRLRAQIVPGQRDRAGSGEGQGSAVPKHAAMTWAQRLKRVFGIEIESCEHCGGAVKIIASIEDPQVIGRILQHLGLDGSGAPSHQFPPARAPPIGSIGLFD